MDIAGIFKDSIEVTKKNYIICAPTLAVMLVTFVLTMLLVGGGIGMGMAGGMHSPGAMMGSLMGGAMLIGLVSSLLGMVAHGMSVGMAKEVMEKGSTSIGSGLQTVMGRLVDIVVASLLASIVIGIGMMLLVIPGLVAAFFLMFTFVLVIVERLGAVDAMKKSYELVRANLNVTVVFAVFVLGISVALAVVNMVFGMIPVLGQIASMVLMSIFGGYFSVVVVRFYTELTQKREPAGISRADELS